MSNRRRAKMPHTPLRPPAPPKVDLTRSQRLAELMRQNRAALEACTGQPHCPSSIHVPDCWVGR